MRLIVDAVVASDGVEDPDLLGVAVHGGERVSVLFAEVSGFVPALPVVAEHVAAA